MTSPGGGGAHLGLLGVLPQREDELDERVAQRTRQEEVAGREQRPTNTNTTSGARDVGSPEGGAKKGGKGVGEGTRAEPDS